MEIGSERWKQTIIEGANEFGIHIDSQKIQKFTIYAQELIKWNRKINLTAIINPFEIAVKHFIDSIVPSLYIKPDASIIDIGSGGGFPGIPLAILYPSLSVTLIDTSRKKISFLKHIARILKLNNVSIYQISAEDFAKSNQFAHSFNIIISRALFHLEKMILVALPLLSKNGEIIAMKGKKEKEDKEIYGVSEILCDWKKESSVRNYTYSIKKYCLQPIGAERTMHLFQFKTERE